MRSCLDGQQKQSKTGYQRIADVSIVRNELHQGGIFPRHSVSFMQRCPTVVEQQLTSSWRRSNIGCSARYCVSSGEHTG